MSYEVTDRDLDMPNDAAKALDKPLKAGLLLSTEADALMMLMMFPALNIEPKVARSGLDILEECL